MNFELATTLLCGAMCIQHLTNIIMRAILSRLTPTDHLFFRRSPRQSQLPELMTLPQAPCRRNGGQHFPISHSHRHFGILISASLASLSLYQPGTTFMKSLPLLEPPVHKTWLCSVVIQKVKRCICKAKLL